jgi:hypothetical protein
LWCGLDDDDDDDGDDDNESICDEFDRLNKSDEADFFEIESSTVSLVVSALLSLVLVL